MHNANQLCHNIVIFAARENAISLANIGRSARKVDVHYVQVRSTPAGEREKLE